MTVKYQGYRVVRVERKVTQNFSLTDAELKAILVKHLTGEEWSPQEGGDTQVNLTVYGYGEITVEIVQKTVTFPEEGAPEAVPGAEVPLPLPRQQEQSEWRPTDEDDVPF